MIISRKPLTLTEAKLLAGDLEEKKILQDYFKEFIKLSKGKSMACTDEIRALNNPKISEENLLKIVDFLPESPEDLITLFSELNLSSEEASAISSIIKKY